jgi:hypothetical protein
MGRPEVGDDPDRWVPPIGERERGKGEVGRRWLLGRKRGMGCGEEKEGEGGEWAVGRMGKGKGFGVCFLFNSFLNNFSNCFFKSNLLHLFHNLFHKLF